jgi:hypothetical protein
VRATTLRASPLIGAYAQALLDGWAALAAAQGAGLTSDIVPAEMNAPATRRLMNALKRTRTTGPDAGQGQQFGWEAADLIICGLRHAGGRASAGHERASFRKNA